MNRLLDLLGAAVLLLILLPLFILLAFCIILDSSGPVFFRQERIGWHMRPFRIFKFRTMESSEDSNVFEFRPRRITRVGRLLRRWKLDELPQLINVLRGEMSLVGPRPELRKYVELFRADYEHLLQRRPGLTDPATIAYRHEADMLASEGDAEMVYVERILPDKLRLSSAYSQRRNLTSDTVIVLRTVAALFD